MRQTIPAEERVAITLWYLSNTISYRVVGLAFGVARSTVATIVIKVCLVVEGELYTSIINPGNPEELCVTWVLRLAN